MYCMLKISPSPGNAFLASPKMSSDAWYIEVPGYWRSPRSRGDGFGQVYTVGLFPVTQALLTAVEVRTFDLNIYTACELGQLFPLNKTLDNVSIQMACLSLPTPTRLLVRMFLIISEILSLSFSLAYCSRWWERPRLKRDQLELVADGKYVEAAG